MTFKSTALSLGLAVLPLAAHAAPFCAKLLDADALPGSYARLAPIHSSTDSGWIFTDEMLSTEYAMKSEAERLMTAIVAEFTRRDVPLAIMIAPPRALVAGQTTVEATIGSASYDANAARDSFDTLIEQLRAAGAIVPNLVDEAIATQASGPAYYFQRDTHWTAFGAALSAQALAIEISTTRPDIALISVPDLEISDAVEEEKGSLAAIVRDVCEMEPAIEPFALARFPSRGNYLLGEATQTPIVALLGTSFSNRYKKDFYRVGDAISWALDREVVNMSESGTGMIGIIEGFVNSGGLDQPLELVIWETPYTESFNSTSNLRQLLGALQSAGDEVVSVTAEGVPDTTVEVGAAQPEYILVDTSTLESIELRVRVVLSNDKTKTIKLRRSDRVPAALRSEVLAAALTGFGHDIRSVSVEVISGGNAADIRYDLVSGSDGGS
jgi:alginate biosynthesis protein AlgX